MNSCDTKILVVVVAGRGNTVYLTINWSKRGLFVNRGATNAVVAQNCEHFQTRSGRVVLWWVECSCCCCYRCGISSFAWIFGAEQLAYRYRRAEAAAERLAHRSREAEAATFAPW